MGWIPSVKGARRENPGPPASPPPGLHGSAHSAQRLSAHPQAGHRWTPHRRWESHGPAVLSPCPERHREAMGWARARRPPDSVRFVTDCQRAIRPGPRPGSTGPTRAPFEDTCGRPCRCLHRSRSCPPCGEAAVTSAPLVSFPRPPSRLPGQRARSAAGRPLPLARRPSRGRGDRAPRPRRHGHHTGPRVHRDSRRAALRPAARRPGAAGRSTPATTFSPPTHSLWWTRPSVPTARSRTPKEDSRDNPEPPSRIPAGRRGGGAADPGADGPVPGRPDLRPQRPHARADVRRVCPGRVRRGDRRHPEGVRQLLEVRPGFWRAAGSSYAPISTRTSSISCRPSTSKGYTAASTNTGTSATRSASSCSTTMTDGTRAPRCSPPGRRARARTGRSRCARQR
jgi:hypothetical protein